MPYDIAILISFAIFIGIVYMIIVHIVVPFIGEFRAFVKSIPDMVTAVQQAIPEIERQYQLSLMPPEAKNFISLHHSGYRRVYAEGRTVQPVRDLLFCKLRWSSSSSYPSSHST